MYRAVQWAAAQEELRNEAAASASSFYLAEALTQQEQISGTWDSNVSSDVSGCSSLSGRSAQWKAAVTTVPSELHRLREQLSLSLHHSGRQQRALIRARQEACALREAIQGLHERLERTEAALRAKAAEDDAASAAQRGELAHLAAELAKLAAGGRPCPVCTLAVPRGSPACETCGAEQHSWLDTSESPRRPDSPLAAGLAQSQAVDAARSARSPSAAPPFSGSVKSVRVRPCSYLRSVLIISNCNKNKSY